MPVQVLKSKEEIYRSRAELDRRKISYLSERKGLFRRIIGKLERRLGIEKKEINIGNEIKSWDILLTINFIEQRCSVDAAILDIGASTSEIICSLYKAGFKNLTGIDLDPKVTLMPFADKIKYVIGDFMQTPFPDNSFDVVTAISVIEHGFNPDLLLKEMSRIIKRGGYFVGSTDYWPEKINTTTQIYGMDWMIFSEKEIKEFIDIAKKYNFQIIGDKNFSAKEKPVEFLNQNYTFLWFAFQKVDSREK